MSSLTQKRNAAGDRYVAAVKEFLDARRDLAALDLLCDRQGFGVHPEMITLRHSTFAPDLHGAVTDNLHEAVERHASAAVKTLP